jgi:hypothetical protein
MNKDVIFKLADDWNLHKEELKTTKYYLFNVKDGNIIKLNEVSFDILSNINGKKSKQNILDTIINLYDIETEIFERDIEHLLKKCIEKGVIIES